MRGKQVTFAFFALCICSSATAAPADVSATAPQAVMQSTTPVPNGQTSDALAKGATGQSSAPVVTSKPGATETQFAGDPNEIICRDSEGVTGTLFKAKVCHTRREWAEAEIEERQLGCSHTMPNGQTNFRGQVNSNGWAHVFCSHCHQTYDFQATDVERNQSGLNVISADDLDDAAQKIVKAVKGA